VRRVPPFDAPIGLLGAGGAFSACASCDVVFQLAADLLDPHCHCLDVVELRRPGVDGMRFQAFVVLVTQWRQCMSPLCGDHGAVTSNRPKHVARRVRLGRILDQRPGRGGRSQGKELLVSCCSAQAQATVNRSRSHLSSPVCCCGGRQNAMMIVKLVCQRGPGCGPGPVVETRRIVVI
jgi:hypothetical protein